jgi:PHD/YefM family antitoxin component YafN of YafNO toxin-antitoxin module
VFSCLGRLGCLFLLLIIGAVAFLTRDTLLPRVTSKSESTPVTWESVGDPGAKKGEDALAALQRPGGPAYVTIPASELAALMVENADYRLPQALDSVQAAVEGETVRVRALVKLDKPRAQNLATAAHEALMKAGADHASEDHEVTA